MEISIIILCLLLTAFFSGMEIAFISSNKIYLEIEKKQDNFVSRILTKLTEKPSQFIATMLVGNNVALVIYGFFMGDLLVASIKILGYNFSSFTNLLLQTILSTFLVLMTSEFLPKVFFQIYANKLIKFFAVPAYVFYKLFHFVSIFVIWISDMILKKFFKTEGDLKREVQQNIKRLKDVKSYRGTRHLKHLPARGQRTKSHFRKNKKKGVGIKKKEKPGVKKE